jgi:hypothetical protein
MVWIRTHISLFFFKTDMHMLPKKQHLLIAGLLLFSFAGKAQLTIQSGATFNIQNGATVTVQGDVTSNADITGTGKLVLKGTAVQNINMNGFSVPVLEVDNAANAVLTGNAAIANDLTFTNGLLLLGNSNLVFSNNATITTPAANKFIVTNNNGVVKKNSVGAGGFFFPVGNSASEYNPLTLTNNGTIDNFTVRATSNVLVNGVNPATENFANNSWVVGEDIAGGSSLTLIGGWDAADELPNFDRSKSGVARYVSGTDWDLPASQTVAASGGDPYLRTRTGVNATGTFAIADLDFVNRATVNLKVFLQGAYTGTGGGIGAGLMRDQLRTLGVLPLTQPYGSGKFIHLGVQGGSETVAPSVFNAAALPENNIVDWVFVTLLDAAAPTTKLQTRAALVQKDGDVVDLDGVSPLSFPIDANGTYHLSVGHRNHLSIRTPDASPLNLVENAAAANWDFTSGLSQAYADPLIVGTNQPMLPITFSGVTKFSLLGGNTDGMTAATAAGRSIIYSGSGNDKAPILSVGLGGNNSITQAITAGNYGTLGRFDLNLNGVIVYSGSGNDPVIILNALGGNTTSQAREHQ